MSPSEVMAEPNITGICACCRPNLKASSSSGVLCSANIISKPIVAAHHVSTFFMNVAYTSREKGNLPSLSSVFVSITETMILLFTVG